MEVFAIRRLILHMRLLDISTLSLQPVRDRLLVSDAPLPTTLMVQIEHSVMCVCVCLCVRTITFELNHSINHVFIKAYDKPYMPHKILNE